jgi:lipopolysaccharide export system protein LptC
VKQLVVGVALAVGALWLAFAIAPWRNSLTPRELPPELEDEPDLYMQTVTITQYQEDGTVRYQLSADQIRHFEGDQLTRLVAPDLSLYNHPEPPWEIASDRGYIRKRPNSAGVEEEVVYLRDNVVLYKARSSGETMTIRSPAFYIYPERQYAETDEDVMIDTEVGRTSAHGMQGELARGLLKLFSSDDSRVHTIVLPDQFKHAD